MDFSTRILILLALIILISIPSFVEGVITKQETIREISYQEYEDNYQTIKTDYIDYELQKEVTHYWIKDGLDKYELTIFNFSIKNNSDIALRFTWYDERDIQDKMQVHYQFINGSLDKRSINFIPLSDYNKTCLDNLPRVRGGSRDDCLVRSQTKLTFSNMTIEKGIITGKEYRLLNNKTNSSQTLNVSYPTYSWSPFSKISTTNLPRDFLSIDDTTVGACGTLSTKGENYTLTTDLSTTGDCMTINNDYITLNLDGYLITGDVGGDGVIFSDNIANHSTVENGTITGFINALATQGTTIHNATLRKLTVRDSKKVWDSIYYGYVDNVTGLNITNKGTGPTAIGELSQSTLNNSYFKDTHVGIDLFGVFGFVYNTKFINASQSGVDVIEVSGSISGPDQGFLIDNITITGSGTGVENFLGRGDSNLTIKNSRINDNEVGIRNPLLNTTLINVNLQNNTDPIVITTDAKETIRLVNVSYSENETISGASTLNITREWYFESNITELNGTALINANVTISDIEGVVIFSGLTDSNGNMNVINITEYVVNRTAKVYNTPHTVNVTKVGYSSSSTTSNLTLLNNTVHTLSLASVFPDVNLTQPLNITYTDFITELNFTVSDLNLETCWYSLDGGLNNVTLTCGDNVTGITKQSGSFTFLAAANDTSNNLNHSITTFTISPEIDTCLEDLTNDNIEFTLNQSLQADATCLVVQANNVTIDCNGFQINYSASADTAYGINITNFNNIKIQNCQLLEPRTGASGSAGIYLQDSINITIQDTNISILSTGNTLNYGVLINNTLNTVIYNMNISTDGTEDYGIYILAQSNNTNVTNNKIDTVGEKAYGIYSDDSHESLYTFNNISTTGQQAHGVFFSNTMQSNVTYNNISTTGLNAEGIYIKGELSIRDSVIANNIKTTGKKSEGIYLSGQVVRTTIDYNNISVSGQKSVGIYLSNSSESYINNNSIDVLSKKGYGIRLTKISQLNNMTRNNISSTQVGAIGFSIESSSDRNLFKDNQVRTKSSALQITKSQSNEIYNNIFNSTKKDIVKLKNAKEDPLTNQLNTTETTETNVIGGTLLGGNYWINAAGKGFSQICEDVDADGICDDDFVVDNTHIDYAPLVMADTTDPTIDFYSPINRTIVNGNVDLKSIGSDDFAVVNVSYEYSNSTDSFTNFCYSLVSPFNCTWVTDDYNNGSEGYTIRVTAYDAQGNTAQDSKHYFIDRTVVSLFDINITYPDSQQSIRDGQRLTLDVQVNDVDPVAAGVNNVMIDLSNLTGESFVDALLIGGSTTGTNPSIWALNITIATTSGEKEVEINATDNAFPLQNARRGDTWKVQVDNTLPDSDPVETIDQTFNNTDSIFSTLVRENFNLSHYIFSENSTGVFVNSSNVSVSGTLEYIEHVDRVATGNFSYQFFLYDDAGNLNETDIGNIEVLGASSDLTIAQQGPILDVFNATNEITFSYIYTAGDVENCTLILDGNQNQTVINPLNNTLLNFSRTLVNDAYDWQVSCIQNETIGTTLEYVEYLSETSSFTVDSLFPNATIDSIVVTENSQTFVFNYEMNDTNFDSCRYNIYNTSGGPDGLNSNVSLDCNGNTRQATATDYGFYNLTITALDLAGNENSTTQLFRLNSTSTSAIGGGGGAPPLASQGVPVVAIKPPIADPSFSIIPDSLTDIERAILYARINAFCGEKLGVEINTFDNSEDCELTVDELEEIRVGLDENDDIVLTFQELERWFIQYKNQELENIIISQSEVDKFNLVQAIVGILNKLRLTSDRVDRFFAFSQSEGSKTISLGLEANKALASCSIVSNTPEFSCNLITNESIQISYNIPDVNFFNRVFQGKISILSDAEPESQESFQIPVIYRVYNFGFKVFGIPIWVFTILSILAITSISIISLTPKTRKKIIKNASQFFS